MEFTQSDDICYITIPITEENLQGVDVDFYPDSFEISYQITKHKSRNETQYLIHNISVDKSSFKYDTKKKLLEIQLYKQNKGKWGKQIFKTDTKKDRWDEIAKQSTSIEEKESILDLNKWFEKIYADGDDGNKQAMMKSFIESGGKSLSTTKETKD